MPTEYCFFCSNVAAAKIIGALEAFGAILLIIQLASHGAIERRPTRLVAPSVADQQRIADADVYAVPTRVFDNLFIAIGLVSTGCLLYGLYAEKPDYLLIWIALSCSQLIVEVLADLLLILAMPTLLLVIPIFALWVLFKLWLLAIVIGARHELLLASGGVQRP